MLHRFDTVTSTMDVLHQLAARGRGGGNGRRRGGAARGAGLPRAKLAFAPGGLWLSVLLRPAAAAEVLSLRVGLAVEDSASVASRPNLHLGLKWPNDLMLGDRKLGGILCEARWPATRPPGSPSESASTCATRFPEALAASRRGSG